MRTSSDEFEIWTREEALALAEYREQLEGELGEEVDIDVAAMLFFV
jgi:hypothetical protein